MKDSQRLREGVHAGCKYIKANNERFSTDTPVRSMMSISISRRIMKDSQPAGYIYNVDSKYIKANNERFSTFIHR